jgi:hypothetical protein
MSSVYLAHHVRLERRVALKLLAPELDQFSGFPAIDRIALAPGSE